ncbi:PEPxxWA-CTERM sorting domain-containing protein [Phenylobacterium sp.]|uniref:PEPxxWA-CTERM sorting domain-containing protein n=1 Tax=Phenylobacterium sp. TaxID=1871053 RepID=UPI00286BAE09|nr:PEPxxWA-CTERM sorting domain-containing protein [Phenylobacterium sp.]
MKSALCAALFLMFGVAPASAATIIDFEDQPGGSAGTTLTIGDVTFASPVELFIGPSFTDDGVTNVLCSRTAGTFGCESDLTVSFASAVSGLGFTVDGANTTAATINALAILADGSSQTITFGGFAPFTRKVLNFGSLQIRSVTFSTTDPQGFAFDDFTFGSAVPEPATWALLIAGFGLVGGSLRRRRALGLAAA